MRGNPHAAFDVAVVDETYRRARIRAAEQDTSVSARGPRFIYTNILLYSVSRDPAESKGDVAIARLDTKNVVASR